LFKSGRDTIYCRFRLQVNAENNSTNYKIPDDADEFLIDNVRLVKYPFDSLPGNKLEVTSFDKKIPYTMIPTGQTNKIPIEVFVQNTTPDTLKDIGMSVKIKKSTKVGLPSDGGDPNFPTGRYIANSWITLLPFENRIIQLPALNMNAGDFIDTFRIGRNNYLANITFSKGAESGKDSNNYKFYVTVGNQFAYDDLQSPRNYVGDEQFSGIPQLGLSMRGFSSGDFDIHTSCGYSGGSGSGRIAMKFHLINDDTIYAYCGFWSMVSGSLDDISYCIYKDNFGLPGDRVDSTLLYSYRGWDDVRVGAFYDEYVTAILKKPVILEPGIYWLSVTQLGETGFNLGASKSRMGMKMTNFVDSLPTGSMNTYLLMDKSLRVRDSLGRLLNDNIFAYSNSRDGNDWVPFMPNIGNPGYSHLNYLGIGRDDSLTKTYSRGTWLPMIRPIFRMKQMPTAVEENNVVISDGLILYPNPATDFLEISYPRIDRMVNHTVDEANHTLKGVVNSEVAIYNVFGEKIPPRLTASATPQEGNLRLDVSALPAGMYFVRIGEKVGKFVKL